MKRRTALAVWSLAVVIGLGSLTARADTEVYVGVNVNSTREFFQPLQPHGAWIQTTSYGQCWRPAYVAQDWRPYTSGNWVWSDYGWYWVSDEPWAWATYHYGRWVMDEYYGWVWVPDTEWAPSWVCWREGGGYVGWAPLPPRCRWDNGGYLAYQETWVAPSWYVFIGTGNFCGRITPHNVVASPTVIHQTVNITNIKQVNNIVVNHGPSVEAMRHVNHEQVRTVRFAASTDSGYNNAVLERRVPPALAAPRQEVAPVQSHNLIRPAPNNDRAATPVAIRSRPARREDNNLRQVAQSPQVIVRPQPASPVIKNEQRRQREEPPRLVRQPLVPAAPVVGPATVQTGSDANSDKRNRQHGSDDRLARRW